MISYPDLQSSLLSLEKAISEENNKISVQYTDNWKSYNYDILEADITKEEALGLLNNQSEFTKYGALLYGID